MQIYNFFTIRARIYLYIILSAEKDLIFYEYSLGQLKHTTYFYNYRNRPLNLFTNNNEVHFYLTILHILIQIFQSHISNEISSLSTRATQILKRTKPEKRMQKAFEYYLKAVKGTQIKLHSTMILQNEKVIGNKRMGDDTHHKPHFL